MNEIRTAFLFTVTITVATPQIVGATPIGERRNVPVTGGTFEGKRLRGTIMPGGSDWIVVRADGVWQLDVRLPLQTDDGALINMSYKGFRHGPAAVLDRLNRGETVDPPSIISGRHPSSRPPRPNMLGSTASSPWRRAIARQAGRPIRSMRSFNNRAPVFAVR